MVLEYMLMLSSIIWPEMVMICSLPIVQVMSTGVEKIPVEAVPTGAKVLLIKIGELQDKDQVCKCQLFHTAPMISIVPDL